MGQPVRMTQPRILTRRRGRDGLTVQEAARRLVAARAARETARGGDRVVWFGAPRRGVARRLWSSVVVIKRFKWNDVRTGLPSSVLVGSCGRRAGCIRAPLSCGTLMLLRKLLGH